ncbi:cAMP-dependent protein kinase regulator [Aureococcus anophagefferens]|nr:cAMP-dependent protein kinase regulator [Aureococcus anophagefferens]
MVPPSMGSPHEHPSEPDKSVDVFEDDLDEQLEALTLGLRRYGGVSPAAAAVVDLSALPDDVAAIGSALRDAHGETAAAVELVEAFHISGGYGSLEQCLHESDDDDDGGAFAAFEALAPRRAGEADAATLRAALERHFLFSRRSRAVTDATLWAVEASTLRRSLAASSSLRLASFVESLNRVSLLAPLTARELAFVARNLKPRSFRDGERIIQQGDSDDRTFFILVDGHVVCEHENSEGAMKHIAALGPGDYFGELALLEKAPRAAHVTATGDATCVALAAEDFERAKLTARTMVRALRTVPALKDLSDDGLAAVSEVFKTRVKRRGLCLGRDAVVLRGDGVREVESAEIYHCTRERLRRRAVLDLDHTSVQRDIRVYGPEDVAVLPGDASNSSRCALGARVAVRGLAGELFLVPPGNFAADGVPGDAKAAVALAALRGDHPFVASLVGELSRGARRRWRSRASTSSPSPASTCPGAAAAAPTRPRRPTTSRASVPNATTGLGGPDQTFSSSATSKSIRVIFGRIE